MMPRINERPRSLANHGAALRRAREVAEFPLFLSGISCERMTRLIQSRSHQRGKIQVIVDSSSFNDAPAKSGFYGLLVPP